MTDAQLVRLRELNAAGDTVNRSDVQTTQIDGADWIRLAWRPTVQLTDAELVRLGWKTPAPDYPTHARPSDAHLVRLREPNAAADAVNRSNVETTQTDGPNWIRHAWRPTVQLTDAELVGLGWKRPADQVTVRPATPEPDYPISREPTPEPDYPISREPTPEPDYPTDASDAVDGADVANGGRPKNTSRPCASQGTTVAPGPCPSPSHNP